MLRCLNLYFFSQQYSQQTKEFKGDSPPPGRGSLAFSPRVNDMARGRPDHLSWPVSEGRLLPGRRRDREAVAKKEKKAK
jgi:hypothetical protein